MADLTPETDGSDKQELETLTACPRPDDEILACVPCCAPYSATQHWKFRVKVTPGTQKKGKASKAAMEVFARTREASQRELEVMRCVTDNERVAVLVGDVRIDTPGLNKKGGGGGKKKGGTASGGKRAAAGKKAAKGGKR